MSLIADALRKRRLEETDAEGGRSRTPMAPPPVVPSPRRSPRTAVIVVGSAVVVGLGVWLTLSPDRPVPAPTSEPMAVGEEVSEPGDGDLAIEGRTGQGPPAGEEFDPATELRIERAVRAWKDARMDGRADEVLGFYGEEFVPQGGGSREAWAAEVRRSLEEPEWMAVALDDLRIEPGGDGAASVRFVETYRDPRRAHRSVRSLRLGPVDGEWRIVAETSRLLDELPVGRAESPPAAVEPPRPPPPAPVEHADAAGAPSTDARELAGAESDPPPTSLPREEREVRLADGSVLRLDFIVWSESRPFVQIDGVFLEPGDRISGWRIEEIHRDRVRLVGPDGRESVLRAR